MIDNNLIDDLYGLDFDVNKSIRYHLARRNFWDSFSRANKIIGILSGSAVVVGITSGSPIVTTISGAIVAFFSALDLVFDFGARSREAEDIRREWSLLAQRIALIDKPTRKELQDLRATRLKIEMSEGPVLDLLERRCAHDEAAARGDPINEAWQLTRWEKRLAQFVVWRPAGR